MNNSSKNNDLNKKYSSEIKTVKETLNNITETPVNSPSLDEIRNLVRTEVAKKEAKQRKSLYIFSIFAFTVLSLMFTLIVKQPMMFIKIQVVSLIAIPFAIFKYSKNVGSQ
jgi:uncharacterized protein DUF5345